MSADGSPRLALRPVLLAALLALCVLAFWRGRQRETAADSAALAGRTPTVARSEPRLPPRPMPYLPGAYPEGLPVFSSAVPVPGAKRVLFVGNSYTFYYGMPFLVEAFSHSSAHGGGVPLECAVLALPNWSFHEHRLSGLQAVLRAERWDAVVLQDFSLRPLTDPEGFQADGAALLELVRAAGAQAWVFQTWARQSEPDAFARIEAHYRRLAEQHGARVVPAGAAWERLRGEPDLALYDYDGSHPTPLGCYATACVFYAALTGQSPVGLPETLAPRAFVPPPSWPTRAVRFELQPGVAARVQRAALAAAGAHVRAPAR